MSLIPRTARYPWDESALMSGEPRELAMYMRRLVKILRDTYKDIYLAFVTLVRLTGEHATYAQTWDPPNLIAGGITTEVVTTEDTVLGDFVLVSFTQSLAQLHLYGYVSDANEVTVCLYNPTAGAVNLASGTLYVRILKRDAS